MSYSISVIVPCYNKYSSIDTTMVCLLNQTIFKKLEIIIIDDCSTDKSLKKLRRYTSRYKNIRLHKMEKNSSVFAVRRLGIKMSTSKFIGFIDMDDKIDPRYFEELLQNMESDVDILQTFSVIKDFGKGNHKDAKRSYYPYNRNGKYTIDLNNDYFVKMITRNWCTLWNRLFRSEVLKPICNLPTYYINFLEDISIMYIAYMNSEVVKTYNTKSCYYYNLTDNVQHLTTVKQADMKAQSATQAFHIINYYIMYSKKVEFYNIVYKYRRLYLAMFTRNSNYKRSFNTSGNILTTEELREKIIREHFAIDEDFEEFEIDKMKYIANNF